MNNLNPSTGNQTRLVKAGRWGSRQLRRVHRHLLAFHRNEEGMIIWGVIVATIFFLALTAFVYNTGKTVAAKIQTQNAADAMAYSGSVWTARGMNTITATNHLIGELNAIYVLHHALGGRHLDARPGYNTSTWEMNAMKWALRYAWYIGLEGSPVWGPLNWHRWTPFSRVTAAKQSEYNVIIEDTRADLNSTLYQAKLVLKAQMLATYVAHRQATRIGYIPWSPPNPNGAAGPTAACAAMEATIAFEYRFLNAIESMAVAMKPAKRAIPGMISALHGYQKQIASPVMGVPVVSVRAVQRIADAHQVDGRIFGINNLPLLMLPVEHERASLSTEDKSQLMRATYPWVVHWRKPVGTALTIGAPTSFASVFYANWTDRYSLQSCVWMRMDSGRRYDDQLTVINRRGSPTARHVGGALGILSGFYNRAGGVLDRFFGGGGGGNRERGREIRLHVVKGLNDVPDGVSKGREAWNNWRDKVASSKEIDNLFCNMAFAKLEPFNVAAAPLFRNENPRGVVCFAQAMVYNANEKRSLRGTDQPRVTWDTLNWNRPVPEFVNRGFWDSSWQAFSQIFQSWRQPRIQLNWQAKLSPVTNHRLLRTSAAASIFDADIRDIMLSGREGMTLTNH